MGSTLSRWFKSRKSKGKSSSRNDLSKSKNHKDSLQLNGADYNQNVPCPNGLFFVDPSLEHMLSACFSCVSKENITDFFEREGFISASRSVVPTVEQINHGLALLDRQHEKRARCDYRCNGIRASHNYVSGSVAENLGSVIIGQQPHTIASDVDIMYLLELNVELNESSTSRNALKAHPSANYDGFFSVRFADVDPGKPWQATTESFLRAGLVRERVAEAVKLVGHSNVAVNGPAITCHDKRVRLPFDLVLCLPLKWPSGWLTEFRERRRPAGWPGPLLLEQLEGELHLVAKPAYRGEGRLWRISFSRPESLLAQNLPPAAHYCLLMLRAVRSALGEEVSLIAPFHLKTCVFWLCERQPLKRWNQMVEAMCTVLDALRLFATAGFLPNFFRPSINALAPPNATYRSQLYQQATHFRRQLQALLQDQLNRFSRPKSNVEAKPSHQLPLLKAVFSQRSSKRSVGAVTDESALPPRDFYIRDEVMELVPDGVLSAAMESLPHDSGPVEEMKNKMDKFHLREGSFIAGCRE